MGPSSIDGDANDQHELYALQVPLMKDGWLAGLEENLVTLFAWGFQFLIKLEYGRDDRRWGGLWMKMLLVGPI